MRERTTFYPAFYRLCFQTVKGWMSFDYPTLERARKAQSKNSPWQSYILACWYVKGARTLDTEVVR